ncbi:MAG: peptide chain release factor-like protein [Phycisphaerales bacterium]
MPAPEPIFSPRPHPATLEESALLAGCDVSKGRSGGPGGQHRNKVETKVTLLHELTGVEAQASERRSAEENRRVAMRRLRLALATHVRCPVPLGEVRSALWLTRCDKRGRIACNAEHWDYPALLAEGLDVVWACQLDVAKAALRLCCTTSQLVKLVKDHPPAMTLLNAARDAAGERVLK